MFLNKRIIAVTLVGVLALSNALAQSLSKDELAGQMNPIISSVAFLTIAPDSRSAGLGDAGVATSPDMASQHWNSSKYAFASREAGVSLSYAPWLRGLGITDINLLYLSGFKRIDSRQVIAGSLRYFSLGEILFTDFYGEPQGNYNPNEFALDASYNVKLSEKFSGGLLFRFIRSDLTGGRSFSGGGETKAGLAGAADISFYYQDDVVLSDKDGELAFGLNISNIGNKISYSEVQTPDFLPANLRLGSRLTLHADEYNSFAFSLDLNKYLVPTPPVYEKDDNGDFVLDDEENPIIYEGRDPDVSIAMGMMQSFYDAPGGFKEELNEIMYSAGVEYMYRDQFALRTGYFNEHENKGNRKYFTVGVGIQLNVFGIDFSYLVPTSGRTSPLENTVRFSLNFYFDRYARTNAL